MPGDRVMSWPGPSEMGGFGAGAAMNGWPLLPQVMVACFPELFLKRTPSSRVHLASWRSGEQSCRIWISIGTGGTKWLLEGQPQVKWLLAGFLALKDCLKCGLLANTIEVRGIVDSG